MISLPISLVVQEGTSRVNSLRLAQNTPIPTNVSVGRYRPVSAGQRSAHLIITCGESDTSFDPSQTIVEATLELRPQEQITEQIEVSIEVNEHGLIQIHGKDLIGGGDIQFDAQLDV